MPESFETRLTVDKSIVELLSKSTYQRHLSHALREMVSNAYDADATKVTIDIDRKADSIVIHDTGTGMTREDFDYYLRIAGKRRGKVKTAKFGRKRIGQFGVGFLSVFPFCRSIKITTTTENSDEVLSAQIPAVDYFKRGDAIDVEAVRVKGVTYKDKSKTTEHFTSITLQGLTDFAKSSISTALPLGTRRRAVSVADWSPLERLKWELQDELPLPFQRGSPYAQFFKYSESDVIQVQLNEETLYRNDLAGDLLDSGIYEHDGVKARYALSTGWKAITPVEMRHVKVRLNNVGVGVRTDFDIARVRPYSHLSWISGELHILEGLNESISLSRDSFVESPAFEKLRDHIESTLRRQATYIENVEASRKTITKHVAQKKQRQVAPTKVVVESNLKKLEDKGFTVFKVQPKPGIHKEAVTINRSKKTVTVVENHPSFRDTIRIAGCDFNIIYKEENPPNGEPCILGANKTITVFSRYPLFRSKRYGQLFERMCILIAVAESECSTPKRMHEFILEHLGETFTEYQS